MVCFHPAQLEFPSALLRRADFRRHRHDIRQRRAKPETRAEAGREEQLVDIRAHREERERAECRRALDELGYRYWEESGNPAYELFLGTQG